MAEVSQVPSGIESQTLPPEADEVCEESLDTLSDHDFLVSIAQFPRRIIAEDSTYNRPEILHLRTLCLNKLAIIFTGEQNLKQLTPYEKHYIMKRLPVNFPILEAIRFISDETYWQKRCLTQWDLCDVSKYDGSWKMMCLQRTIEQLIHNYVPDGSDLSFSTLKPIIVAANKYIKRLDIKKLKAVESNQLSRMDDDPREDEEFRINFEMIFANLPNLEELKLTYSVQDCGEKFEWYMERLTHDDVRLLQAALLPCYNLRILHLYKSDLDCIKLNLLMRGLLHLPSLQHLYLPHNKIGDKGAFCLAKLLVSTTILRTLDLQHNRIGSNGAEAIAFGLTKNLSLTKLNVRLNTFGDVGSSAMCRMLAANKTLKELNLASNDVGEETAEILAEAMKYNHTLVSLDLSCNPKIGMVGGVYIIEGLEQNSGICELDMRWCESGADTEYYLDQLLKQNRKRGDPPRSMLSKITEFN